MSYPPRTLMPVTGIIGSPFITTNIVQAVPVRPLTRMPSTLRTSSLGHMVRQIRPRQIAPQMIMPPRNYAPHGSTEFNGPPVTVFVGNITDKAPDIMIRNILNTCGPVVLWKRVQGASGKLQAFGFCEFANPDTALRAIRLLHDYKIDSNKLVVKADQKTTEILNEYKEKRKTHTKRESSPLQDEKKEDTDDYMDEEMREIDKICKQRIQAICTEHRKDFSTYVSQPREERKPKQKDIVQERLVAVANRGVDFRMPTLQLENIDDVEEDKREIVSREIIQFREAMKKQEEEKERERKQRENDRDQDRDRNREKHRDSSREREREREDKRIEERIREREREREREKRERDREMERREREREFEKERERRNRSRSVTSQNKKSRSRSESLEGRHRQKRSRSRSRDASQRKSDKDKLKEKEKSDEERERKEQERKIRKKEMQYQERLRNWESREYKKQKELDKEAGKEKKKEIDREREARKLREYLEDYDDDRDDHKLYKGHSLQRRLTMRQIEIESDNKDRAKEKEELEELRTKIQLEGHDNPELIYERALQKREEQYKPKLILSAIAKPPKIKPPVIPPPVIEASPPEENNRSPKSMSKERTMNGSPQSDDSPRSMGQAQMPSPEPQNDVEASNDNNLNLQIPKKKKLEVNDVFNQDDEDEQEKKKRPLPGKEKTKEMKTGDDKRKHIKSLIDKIPTGKAELFSYPIDHTLVDHSLMEKRIRPWINKKIIEYIGEPEPTLVDFICSKVLVGSEPQSLLNDVQMVLDDEADVFVVKMWRLLIYEIEAKKLGLAKI